MMSTRLPRAATDGIRWSCPLFESIAVTRLGELQDVPPSTDRTKTTSFNRSASALAFSHTAYNVPVTGSTVDSWTPPARQSFLTWGRIAPSSTGGPNEAPPSREVLETSMGRLFGGSVMYRMVIAPSGPTMRLGTNPLPADTAAIWLHVPARSSDQRRTTWSCLTKVT